MPIKSIRKIVQVLVKSRVLLKKGWTQEWFARDADGVNCDENSKQATCWCITGALCRVDGGGVVFQRITEELERSAKVPNIVMWNDAPGRTQDEVLKLFDRTIRRLRAQEARK